GYEGDIRLGQCTGIDNRNRDTVLGGGLNHGYQGSLIRRSDYEPVNPTVDEIFHDVDLPADLNFGGRSIPKNLNSAFCTCRFSPGFHRLPKDVGLSLGDNRNCFLLAAIAGRTNGHQSKQERQNENRPVEGAIQGVLPSLLLLKTSIVFDVRLMWVR